MRDEWEKFNDIKVKTNPDKMTILYNSDPFSAESMSIELDNAKQKNVVEKQAESLTPWLKYPTLEIDKHLREKIEAAIKANPDISNKEESGLVDCEETIVSKLIQKGFSQNHIKEAYLYRKTLQGCLDWLCIHVPEDDLPDSVRPKDLNRIEHQILDTEGLSQEFIVRRLASIGFKKNHCNKIVEGTKDEMHAVTKLCWSLIDFEKESNIVLPDPEFDEILDEEIEVIKSIYSETEFSYLKAPGGVSFTFDIQQIKVDIIISKKGNYPHNPPAVVVKGNFPAYIRLSLMQMSLNESLNYRSSPMIFSIISWINDNWERVINFPPPLATLNIHSENVLLKLDQSIISTKYQKNQQLKPMKRSKKNINKEEENERLFNYRTLQLTSADYQAMQHLRSQLPAFKLEDEICRLVKENQVLLICGETGCGKSTYISF